MKTEELEEVKQRAEDGELPEILIKYLLRPENSYPPLYQTNPDRAVPESDLENHLISLGYGREQAKMAIYNGVNVTFFLARFIALKKYAPDGNNKWIRLTSSRFLNGK